MLQIKASIQQVFQNKKFFLLFCFVFSQHLLSAQGLPPEKNKSLETDILPPINYSGGSSGSFRQTTDISYKQNLKNNSDYTASRWKVVIDTSVFKIKEPDFFPNRSSSTANNRTQSLFHGTVTVGTGGTYTSLTNTGGLFEFLNNTTMDGPITCLIISNLTAETGQVPLLALLDDGLGPYMLTIQPDNSVLRIISSTAAPSLVSLIRFDAVKNLIIDGSYNGSGKYLLFRNTNSSASSTGLTIAFYNSSSKDTVRNCYLEGNSTVNPVIGLINSGIHSKISISNNEVRGATGGTIGNCAIGVGSQGASTQIDFSSNTIHHFNSYGIYAQLGDAGTINSNQIYQPSTSTGTTQYGIHIFGTGNGHLVSGNYIGGTAAFCGGASWTSGADNWRGISILTGSVTQSLITNNTIQNINLTSTNLNAFGLGIVADNPSYVKIYGNLIGHPTTPNSIQYAGGSNGSCMGIFVITPSMGGQLIDSNYVSNITVSGTSVLNGIGIETGTSVISNVTRNVIKKLKITSATNGNNLNGIVNSLFYNGGYNNFGTPGNGNVIGDTLDAANFSHSGPGSIHGLNLSLNGTNGVSCSGNIIGGFTESSGFEVDGILFTNYSGLTLSNINNNLIKNLNSTSQYIEGIRYNPSSTSCEIKQNRIANLSTSSFIDGIYYASATSKISGNEIYNLNASPTRGIWYSASNSGSEISDNKIYNFCSLSGTAILADNGAANLSIFRNIIYQANKYSLFNPINITGIDLQNITSTISVNNNMIAFGKNISTASNLTGINCSGATGVNYTANFYFNSITIEGAGNSGSTSSFCFVRSNTSATVNIKNNIFSNTRGNGTGKNYAIANLTTATGWNAGVSDYNLLNAINPATVGKWGSTDKSFAQWQTISAGDLNSFSNYPVYFSNSSNADLHLNYGTLPAPLESRGVLIPSLTSDIDNDTRPGPIPSTNGGGTAPDIGADEFDGVPSSTCSGTPVAGSVTANSITVCPGMSVALSFTGASTGSDITYQWQSAPATSGTWTDILNANSIVLVTTPNSSTDYRAKVTCITSNTDAFSSIATVNVNSPTYATIPYSTSFENTWLSNCDNNEIPDIYWSANPVTGTGSWRREDDLTSAGWTFTSVNSGVYSPPASQGNHSARFHSNTSSSGVSGSLNLYVDASSQGAAGFALQFDFINAFSIIGISYSTNGGANFTILTGAQTPTGGTGVWMRKNIIIPTNSANTVIRFAYSTGPTSDPGIDNLKIDALCTGSPVSGVLTASPTAICTASGSATLTDAGASDNPSIGYSWKSSPTSGGPYSTIIQQSNNSINLTNISTTTYYAFVATCLGSGISTTSNEVMVRVAPITASINPSSASICPGQSASLSANPTGNGETYLWSGGTGTTQSVSVSPSVSSNYAVTVTNIYGCTGSGSAAVTINPVPQGVTANVTSNSICQGTPVNLSSSANSYVYNVLSENFNGTAPGWTKINNSTGGSPTLAAWTLRTSPYTFSPTTFNSNDVSQFIMTNSRAQGSGGTTSTFLQSPAFSTLNISTCTLSFYEFYNDAGFNSGDLAKVDVSTNGSTWSTVNTQTTTSGNSSAFFLFNVNLNAYVGLPIVYVRFNYQASNNFYWAIDNVNISGTGIFSYNWSSVPSGFSSTQQNPTGVTPSVSSVYSVAVTNNYGCSTSASKSVTVNFPTASLSGAANSCNGSQANISLNFTAGTQPWHYTISDGSTVISNSSSATSVSIPVSGLSPGLHTFNVTSLTDANCTGSGSGTATVLVSTTPTGAVQGMTDIATGQSIATACNGTILHLQANGNLNGIGLLYDWNKGTSSGNMQFSNDGTNWSSTLPFTTNVNNVWIKFGAMTGGYSKYNVCVQGKTLCSSTSNYCFQIRGTVSTPASISGPALVCTPGPGPTSTAYNCASVSNAYQYRWTCPGMTDQVVVGSTNATLPIPVFATTASLCVQAELACGATSAGPPTCITLTHQLSVVGNMTGNASACPASTGTYSVPLVTGATSYIWTVPAGSYVPASVPNSEAIAVTFPNPYTGNPAICVTANGSCTGFTNPQRCKNVATSTPTMPGTMQGPTSGVCAPSTVGYNVPAASAGSPPVTGYTWTYPTGVGTYTSTTSNAPNSITFNAPSPFVSGTVSVVANNSNCPGAGGISQVRSITVTGAPGTAVSITPTAPCSGVGTTFTATYNPVLLSSTYTWATSGTGGANTAVLEVPYVNSTTNTVVATITGTVNLLVTAKNSCGTGGTKVQFIASISCRDAVITDAANFSAYPNPAHDKLTVSIDAREDNSYQLQLMDVAGRIVLSESIKATEGSNSYEMNLSSLSKGIYMLQVQSKNDNWKTKVVVE